MKDSEKDLLIDTRKNGELKKFDELEPDILSVLTRTLMDLDDRIQIYKRGLQHGEMFNAGHYRKPKEKVGLKEGGFISLKDIMSEVNP